MAEERKIEIGQTGECGLEQGKRGEMETNGLLERAAEQQRVVKQRGRERERERVHYCNRTVNVEYRGRGLWIWIFPLLKGKITLVVK